MTKIEDYSKEIPEEIRRAIRGLASDYRAAIFVALYKHGELSFSELQKKLEIGKAKLNFHLGKLIESALVHHYYKHELGNEKYSFYNATPFGQNFLETLGEFFRPRPHSILLKDPNLLMGMYTTMLNSYFKTIVASELEKLDFAKQPFRGLADANDPTIVVISLPTELAKRKILQANTT